MKLIISIVLTILSIPLYAQRINVGINLTIAEIKSKTNPNHIISEFDSADVMSIWALDPFSGTIETDSILVSVYSEAKAGSKCNYQEVTISGRHATKALAESTILRSGFTKKKDAYVATSNGMPVIATIFDYATKSNPESMPIVIITIKPRIIPTQR